MLSVIKPPVWFLILIIGFPQLSETIFSPLLPFIMEEFKTTQTMSQMSLSVYFSGFSIGVLFWGRLSDLIGRKKALLFGILCYTLGSFLLYFSTSIEILLVYRVIQAFGAASGSVISQTILRECFIEEKERIHTFSVVSAALAWTPALGPLFGGQLVALLGMKAVFLFLVIIGLGLSLSTVSILSEKNISDKKTIPFFAVLGKMTRDPDIYLYTFFVAGMNTIIFSCYSETPFIFISNFKWSPRAYSFIGIGMALFSMIGAKINKELSYKNWSGKNRIQFGLLWILGSSLLFILPSLLDLSSHQNLYMIWLLLSLWLMFIGIVVALPSVLSESLQSYKDCLGTAGALFGSAYYIFLSFFLGCVSFFSSENTYFLGAVMAFFSLSMLIATKKLKG